MFPTHNVAAQRCRFPTHACSWKLLKNMWLLLWAGEQLLGGWAGGATGAHHAGQLGGRGPRSPSPDQSHPGRLFSENKNKIFKTKILRKNQFCGSMTFWYGSGSADLCLLPMDSDPDPGSGFCYFRHGPWRCQQKTNFFSKSKRSHKTVGIQGLLAIFARWSKDPDPFLWITYPDPGGPKKYRIRIFIFVLSTGIDWQYAVLTSFNAFIFVAETQFLFAG